MKNTNTPQLHICVCPCCYGTGYVWCGIEGWPKNKMECYRCDGLGKVGYPWLETKWADSEYDTISLKKRSENK